MRYKLYLVILLLQRAILAVRFGEEFEGCNGTLAICQNETSFIMCFGNKLVGPIRKCPPDWICVGSLEEVCRQKESTKKSNENPRNQTPSPKLPYCTGLNVVDYDKEPRCGSLFQNTNSSIPGTGCRRFYHCGVDVEEIYECPETYFFNGKECIQNYKCPDPCVPIPKFSAINLIAASSQAMYSSGLSRWPIKGTNCKIFTEWAYDDYGKVIGITQECPPLSWFDPQELRCRVKYFCEDEPNSLVRCEDGEDHGFCDPEFNMPICYDHIPKPVKGSGCQFYAGCDAVGAKIYKCPGSHLFDPELRRCTKTYVCPDPCEMYPENGFSVPEPKVPVCEKLGFFPVLNTDCSKFVKCGMHGPGDIRVCPVGSWFDPVKQTCDPDYKCPEITCVPLDLSDIESENTEEIECTKEGIVEIGRVGDCIETMNCIRTARGWTAEINYCADEVENVIVSTPSPKDEMQSCIKESTCEEKVEAVQNTVQSNKNISSTNKTEDAALNKISQDASKNNIFSKGVEALNEDYEAIIEKSVKATSQITTPVFFTTTNSRTTTINMFKVTDSNYVINNSVSTSSSNPDNMFTTSEMNKSLTVTQNIDQARRNEMNDSVISFNKTKSTTQNETYSDVYLTTKQITETTERMKTTIIDLKAVGLSIKPDVSKNTQGKIDHYTVRKDEASGKGVFVSSTEICIPHDRVIPECNSHGKFAIKYSHCKDYIICRFSFTRVGWLSREYRCPGDSHFDPVTKKCSTFYECKEKQVCRELNYENDMKINDEKMSVRCENGIQIEVPHCKIIGTGRHEIKNSGCKKYMVCTKRSKEFQSKIFNCPESYFFDPVKAICTLDHKCQDDDFCTKSFTKTPKSTPLPKYFCPENGKELLTPECTAKGYFPFKDTGCKKYIYCLNYIEGFIAKVMECPVDTYFDPETQSCEFENNCQDIDKCANFNETVIQCNNKRYVKLPKCKKPVKYPIPDIGCTMYLKCVEQNISVNKSAKTYRGRVYTCPSNTLFNPRTSKCEQHYNCVDKNICALRSKRRSSKKNNSTVTIKCKDGKTVSVPKCISPGKFIIEKTGCRKFLICNKTKSGMVSKIESCSTGTFFDNLTKICSTTFECEDDDVCENFIYQQCHTLGKTYIHGTNCKEFTNCHNVSGRMILEKHECAVNTYFDPKTNECNLNYKCNENFEVDEEKLLCITKNSIPDMLDVTCKKYVKCSIDQTGNVIRTTLICENNTYFDPQLRKCSTIYKCPKFSLKNIVLDLHSIAPRISLDNGQCTTVGRFIVPNTNCKQYTFCRPLKNGVLVPYNFKCGTTSVFRQSIQKCSLDYICPENQCIGFLEAVPNPNSKDCKSYIKCSFDAAIGKTLGQETACPINTYFNPQSLTCEANFVCPS